MPRIADKHLSQLAEKHAQQIAGMKARGKKVLAFDAPCCGKEIETPAPPKGHTWDTLATCQHCGALYYKIVTHRKAIGCVPAESGGLH
jgi:hypothetical protein